MERITPALICILILAIGTAFAVLALQLLYLPEVTVLTTALNDNLNNVLAALRSSQPPAIPMPVVPQASGLF